VQPSCFLCQWSLHRLSLTFPGVAPTSVLDMNDNSTVDPSIQHQAEPSIVPTSPSTSAPPAVGKPSVLIIGGLGYIGRFLARYIHENNLASEVRLVDKQLPELAWLAPEFSEACGRDKFMQADASRERESKIRYSRDLVMNDGTNTYMTRVTCPNLHTTSSQCSQAIRLLFQLRRRNPLLPAG